MRKVSPQNPSGTRSIVKGFLYSTTAIAMIAAPAQANDMDEMRAELQNLLDRMERVEGQQVAAQTAAPIMNRNIFASVRRNFRRGMHLMTCATTILCQKPPAPMAW